MHQRGRFQNVYVMRPIHQHYERVLTVFDRLPFDFSASLHYPRRFDLLPNDVVVTECEFSTEHDVEPVHNGWTSNEEMCLTSIYYMDRVRHLESCIGLSGPGVFDWSNVTATPS
jgi:hypothetical protein